MHELWHESKTEGHLLHWCEPSSILSEMGGLLFVTEYGCSPLHWSCPFLLPISLRKHWDSRPMLLAQVLQRFWGSKLRCSQLQCKCFTHWGTLPAPIPKAFLCSHRIMCKVQVVCKSDEVGCFIDFN